MEDQIYSFDYRQPRLNIEMSGSELSRYHRHKQKKFITRDSSPKLYAIESYGLIPFTFSKTERIPLFLLQQRRDSYEYMEFMRGMWDTESKAFELLSCFSKEERERIRNYILTELWDDLWVLHDSDIYKEGFARAKKKYDLIKDKLGVALDSLSTLTDIEPPWGFPKGKKNRITGSSLVREESDIDCALREFREETRLSTDTLRLWNTKPFSELFRGNNNKLYSTHYYLAEFPETLPIKRIQTPGCIRQTAISEEAGDLRWMTYEEACLKLEPRRQNMLKKVLHLIETRYQELSPFHFENLELAKTEYNEHDK